MVPNSSVTKFPMKPEVKASRHADESELKTAAAAAAQTVADAAQGAANACQKIADASSKSEPEEPDEDIRKRAHQSASQVIEQLKKINSTTPTP